MLRLPSMVTKKPKKKARRPAPRSRAEQKQDTRERIRDAAWALFLERGYEETTTKEIAARAGVAAGTVFVHASDKEDLLFLVMHERLAETVEAALASVPPGPLVSRLMFVYARLFAMYGEHPALSAAFVRSVPGAKGPNAQRLMMFTLGFLHRVSSLVVDGQQTGEISREIDPLLASQNAFALYFSALLSWVNGYATLETALEPLLRSSLDLAVRGLR
ncbi:MAG: TetR/AcrR family transcriptional regulator [Myxococcales bacterium]|nr:TetR/AcrR family transcriptional regulator [Myxococcales bacterium]